MGPLQSDFGWVVVKVDSVAQRSAKSLADVRGEIAAKLAADKSAGALEELVDKIQTELDDGASFSEAATAAKLPVMQTPLVTANGTALGDRGYKIPKDLAPALKAGFEVDPSDEPEIVSLNEDQGYALVAPARVVAAAPKPFGEIKALIRRDYVGEESAKRAKAAADKIAQAVSKGTPLADAAKLAGVALPSPRPLAARRIQIANPQGQIPAPMRMLFTLPEGKSKMVVDDQGRGFFVVKTEKIVPGNALMQPALIGQMQTDLQEGKAQEYAAEFMAAVRADVGVEKDPKALAALLKRLRESGN